MTASEKDLKNMHGEEYALNFEINQNTDRLTRLLALMDLRESQRVLDIGCGNGLLMALVSHKVGQYVGVDFSEPLLKRALSKAKQLGLANVDFFCGDVTIYCEDERVRPFDRAFAMDISEHVYDEDWVQILSAVRKKLAPGGCLYLHTPSASFFIERMKKRNILLKQFPEHIAVRSAAHNVALLKQAGFGEVTVSNLPHYNWLKYIHFLSELPFVGHCFAARLFLTARP